MNVLCGNRNVKTHKKLKRWATRTHQKNGGELVKGKLFLLLIRHPQCDSYIQLTMANDQCTSIHTRINSCQCFSTIMILRSVRKLVCVSRNRTRNGSFCCSMWLKSIVGVRSLTFTFSWRQYGTIESWNKKNHYTS
jgi:hypothetical protein